MMYQIKIKGSTKVEIIHAKTEMKAKFKFCEKNGLNYLQVAGTLEVICAPNQPRRGNPAIR
jgi:hypothetical protein